jgi:hypothetical protein
VLCLAGITVTHMDTHGWGVNVTEGGKLYMTNGEISGNEEFWNRNYHSYGAVW